MREILFRGKRIDNGEWVEGGYKHEKVGEYFTAVFIIEHLTSGVWGNHRVEPSTVGQYTGMKDKNGERIFEGDILRIVLTDGHEDGPIVWSDIDARYHFESPDGCSYGICEWNDLEVIGNIHDNPELLNGGDAE